VPGFGAVEADIEVPRELRAQWRSLEATVRECVAALLNGSTSSGASAFIVAVPLPEGFARALACGGRGFRAAFSALTRHVVEIGGPDELISIRVACEGDQDRPFFHLVSPTRRHVQFEVVHRLTIERGRVLEDRIALDVRTIVLQLAAPRRPVPGGPPSSPDRQRRVYSR
jgi:hypothetical protein